MIKKKLKTVKIGIFILGIAYIGLLIGVLLPVFGTATRSEINPDREKINPENLDRRPIMIG